MQSGSAYPREPAYPRRHYYFVQLERHIDVEFGTDEDLPLESVTLEFVGQETQPRRIWWKSRPSSDVAAYGTVRYQTMPFSNPASFDKIRLLMLRRKWPPMKDLENNRALDREINEAFEIIARILHHLCRHEESQLKAFHKKYQRDPEMGLADDSAESQLWLHQHLFESMDRKFDIMEEFTRGGLLQQTGRNMQASFQGAMSWMSGLFATSLPPTAADPP